MVGLFMVCFSCGLYGAKIKKMAGSVRVLNECGGGGIVEAVGGFFAHLVRAFGAAYVCGIGWGVGYSFHLVGSSVMAGASSLTIHQSACASSAAYWAASSLLLNGPT
jgi:hypothetical protein